MRNFLIFILLLIALTGCLAPPGGLSPPASQHPWAAALRALDPAGASDPAQDITAVYIRTVEGTFQVRVDLLDFQHATGLSLDIEIGDASAPGATPLAIHIPSEEGPFRVDLDPLLATVIVEVPLSILPSRPRVDVSTREERVTGLAPDGPVPPQNAPLLLAFYDSFAGRFPAEALRRWDGAHSGPRGTRHGLKHLLDAAQEHHTPIVLLDLKEPQNLSALEAMGALPRIQQLEQQGLLILPDQAEQNPLFGFSPSQFNWGGIPLRSTLPSRLNFVLSSDPSYIYRPLFSKTTFLPIAMETDSSQPTRDGPSLAVRRALLETALNGDTEDLLVLGGSLRDSTWGNPDMLGPTLAYYASRPYIQILSAENLRNFPTKRGKPDIRAFPSDDSQRKLDAHYQTLTLPVLEFVANWDGFTLLSCESDLDNDNQPECVLANSKYLAILDPQGARLTYFFAVGQAGEPPYQLIGPSWQVAVGLSNPSRWDFAAGEAADPGANPGAFADADDPFKPYQPAIEGNRIIFTSTDRARIKTYTLDETGLQVEYQTREPVRAQIPLLVEPLARFTPGWAQRYVQKKTPEGITWGLVNGPMVSLHAKHATLSLPEEALRIRAFNDSLPLLSVPEDPDFDYPAGHYIPFPLAIAEVEMQDGYFLRLERLP